MTHKSNLTLGDTYTASQTELLVAQVVIPSSGSKGTIKIILIEGSNETILASATALRVGTTASDPCNTASAPIYKDQQYKIVLETDAAGDANGYAYYSAI